MLVIVRPAKPQGTVVGHRNGRMLELTNTGNTNVEMYDRQQCDSQGKNCIALLSRRLYSGVSWSQQLPYGGKVSYHIKTENSRETRPFSGKATGYRTNADVGAMLTY